MHINGYLSARSNSLHVSILSCEHLFSLTKSISMTWTVVRRGYIFQDRRENSPAISCRSAQSRKSTAKSRGHNQPTNQPANIQEIASLLQNQTVR
jgi:DNA-binding winged helix-turn-helix (wHTH) protein